MEVDELRIGARVRCLDTGAVGTVVGFVDMDDDVALVKFDMSSTGEPVTMHVSRLEMEEEGEARRIWPYCGGGGR